MTTRKVVSLSVKSDIIDYIDDVAALNGISRSRMIEKILQDRIDEWEEAKNYDETVW